MPKILDHRNAPKEVKAPGLPYALSRIEAATDKALWHCRSEYDAVKKRCLDGRVTGTSSENLERSLEIVTRKFEVAWADYQALFALMWGRYWIHQRCETCHAFIVEHCRFCAGEAPELEEVAKGFLGLAAWKAFEARKTREKHAREGQKEMSL